VVKWTGPYSSSESVANIKVPTGSSLVKYDKIYLSIYPPEGYMSAPVSGNIQGSNQIFDTKILNPPVIVYTPSLNCKITVYNPGTVGKILEVSELVINNQDGINIVGEKYKSNSFEIIQKKTDVCSNDLIKKLSNKLKRYGITSKNYYINISCSEYEYTDYVINASIKNEYIPLYCYSTTIPAKYTISGNVRAYTANHALSIIADPTSNYKHIREVINHKHYDYYEVLEYKNNA
jgi:hypothetical protein